MRFVVLLFWLSFLPKLSASALHIEGKIFRDANGNHSILRGINVTGAAKIPPFRGISGPEVLAPLRAWGFNSIRLLFNWEAFEPSPGSYDLNYLKYYRDMIDWAGQSDLYVIADIHQDAYSRASIDGCGEGFPIWTLPPETKAAEPDNGSKCVNWAIRAALDWSMHRDWHHFYQNSYGARDHYLDMLERLAEAIASAPNLVGFDLLNEPWGRDEELMQLYTDATERVRRHIPDALVFLSSHALTSTGIIPSRLPKPNFDQAV
ncbi:MAG: cellulase family glycosylhydrolase, partial [Proteobacteria bacterium]|nr:cellulase family glycosylhydrolase [Pseudomonadota bacterium]